MYSHSRWTTIRRKSSAQPWGKAIWKTFLRFYNMNTITLKTLNKISAIHMYNNIYRHTLCYYIYIKTILFKQEHTYIYISNITRTVWFILFWYIVKGVFLSQKISKTTKKYFFLYCLHQNLVSWNKWHKEERVFKNVHLVVFPLKSLKVYFVYRQ